MGKNNSQFNKHFFEQFKDEIEEEHREHKTYQEKTKTEDNKCSHSRLRMVGRELRCVCGAFWSGTAEEILKTKEILEKRNSHLKTPN